MSETFYTKKDLQDEAVGQANIETLRNYGKQIACHVTWDLKVNNHGAYLQINYRVRGEPGEVFATSLVL